MANNTITAPKGFLAAGVKCGIKKSGKHDLGLIVCPAGAKAAGVFTTNKITSAAVQISQKHVKSDTIYAVVVNSGNANACTGERGIKNAIAMCSETARGLRLPAFVDTTAGKLRFARNDAIRTTQYAPRKFWLPRRASSASICRWETLPRVSKTR